jgi:esterase/lipase
MLYQVIDYFKNYKIYVLGHSLGASLSLLVNNKPQVKKIISISSPKEVGSLFGTQPLLQYLSQLPLNSLEYILPEPREIGGIIFDGKALAEFIKDSQEIRMIDYVDKISPIDLYLFHGTEDNIVPIYDALELYEKAKPPKTFVPLDGEGHDISENAYQTIFKYVKL